MKTAAPPGWLTISDLARERGVDKAAISRRVARLETIGQLSTRPHGQAKIVNVEEFDRACAATVDAVREMNGRSATAALSAPAAPAIGGPILANEQARRASFDAELKRLDLAERLGRLVEIESVRFNIEECALELVRTIDQLPSRADALAAVMTKDGVTGLRTALRGLAREMRVSLAHAAERFAEGEGANASAEAAA